MNNKQKCDLIGSCEIELVDGANIRSVLLGYYSDDWARPPDDDMVGSTWVEDKTNAALLHIAEQIGV